MKPATWQTSKLANRNRSFWLYLLVCQFSSLFVCVPALADEPVVLRTTLSEGNTLRYQADAKLEVKSDKARQTLEQHLSLRFTIARAGKGGALIRGRIESLKVRSEVTGHEPEEFAWHEGEAPGPEEDAGLSGLYRQLGGTVFEVTLDASGKIDSVSGLERIREEARGVDNASRLMGILAPDAAPRMLQGVFAIDTEGKPRTTGESWVTLQEFNAGVWQAKARTEYTVKGVSEGVALISGSTTILPPSVTQGEDLRPKTSILSQTSRIDAQWDVKNGRLLSRVTDGTLQWKATLPLKEPIEAVSTSASHIEFKLLGEDAPPKPPR